MLGCNEDGEPAPSPASPRTCLDPDIEPTQPPNIPLTYATEHIDIHVAEDQFLCAGSAQDYDRFVTYVATQMSIELERRISMFIDGQISDCATYSRGCTMADGVILTMPYATYHELAHATMCQERTAAPPFLAEGFAVSFEQYGLDSSGNPSEFAEVRRGHFGMYYEWAGHFVRWLQEQLGPEAFLDLYTTATYSGGVWAAVEDAYGTMAEADYHATAPAMWIPHRQCADLFILEPNDEKWLYESTFDCSSTSTLGPYERVHPLSAHYERTSMYQSFLIDIPTPGTYRIGSPDPETHGWTGVNLEPCLDEHPATKQDIEEQWVQDVVWFVPMLNTGTVEFEHAGLWRVDVLREHGPPVDVWVTIERVPD
jgi:hypothetical protein